MPIDPVRQRRLASQRLIGDGFATPADVVGWLGAVQAQDFHGAKWALAQRMLATTDAAIENAFNRGEFLRTHALRPTWHFLAPADLRWVQALTGGRVQAMNAGRYRQLELDPGTLTRSATIMTDALAGGHALTRRELGEVLEQQGIGTTGQRLAHLVMYAELEALVCSGPLRGKQHTYALVDERVSPMPSLPRAAALERLARTFFSSHGPATDHDFAWWSGLTLADCREGIALAGDALEQVAIGGVSLWAGAEGSSVTPRTPLVHLLPNYDEYYSRAPHTGLVGDQDEDQRRLGLAVARSYVHHLVIDGAYRGGWRRDVSANLVRIQLDQSLALDREERIAVERAATAYGTFMERGATVA